MPRAFLIPQLQEEKDRRKDVKVRREKEKEKQGGTRDQGFSYTGDIL